VSGEAGERGGRGGLAFFGALAASVTHELNNALSIIDQAGGLLGDLAAGAAAGRPIDPRRLETVRERIDRQVRKGVEIVTRLNRFAHSIDEPEGEFDAVAETENLVALTLRFAELKKVRLELAPCAERIGVRGDAFALQQALFACLRAALDGAEEGDRIEVRPRREGAEGVLAVHGPGRVEATGEAAPPAGVERLMETLGGSCRARPGEDGGAVLELRFPAAPASGD